MFLKVNEHLTPAKMDRIFRVLAENRNEYLSNLKNEEDDKVYVHTIVLNANEIRCDEGNQFSAFERFLKNICGNLYFGFKKDTFE